MNTLNLINQIFENDKPVFVMLVGCPGSGKTSYARELLEYLGSDFEDSIELISTDDIRSELTGDSNNQTENRRVFDAVYSLIGHALKRNKSVIYDATNTISKHRNNILGIVNKYNVAKVCVIMDTPLIECLMNNNKRDRKIPSSTIEKMYISSIANPPTTKEGFDVIINRKYDEE